MSRSHPVTRTRHRPPNDAPPINVDDSSPLDIINWLLKRYCAVIEQEDERGEMAGERRIDAALKAAAALVRTAAPYRHPRIKPADPPQKKVREIIEVRWAGTPEHRVGASADDAAREADRLQSSLGRAIPSAGAG